MKVMMVVKRVLVEKVEMRSATEAMTTARRKTAKTAPWRDQRGDLDGGVAHGFCHGDAVGHDHGSAHVEDAGHEEVHEEEGDEHQHEDAQQFSGEVIEAGDGFGEDGVEGAVFDILGQEEGGGDDGEDHGEEGHGAERPAFDRAEDVDAK
jgi:hypothetical protein